MCVMFHWSVSLFFFFNDTATTEIYTLSLHDALPISDVTAIQGTPTVLVNGVQYEGSVDDPAAFAAFVAQADRKSTRLNSSHANISYAVFCLKKKKTAEHAKLL